MNSYIGVYVITLLSSTKILVNADNECKESLLTAEKVTSCPKTAKEWNKAAERKGCKHITNACSSFEYHCVTNVWRNETFEVCAPQWNIVGMSCVEYNFGGKRIQKGRVGTCYACPITYPSTEIYKYQECYPMKLKKILELQGNTEPAVVDPTTLEHNTSSLSRVLSHGLNYRPSNSENTPNFLYIIIIVVCVIVGAPVLLTSALIVYKSRKNLSCSKIYRPDIEENSAPSVEYSTSDTYDSTEGEKDPLTTRISNNQGICSESNESKEDRQPFKTSIICH